MSLSERLRERELSRLREVVAHPLWYEQIDRESRGKRIARVALSHVLEGKVAGRKAAAKDDYYSMFEQLLAENVVRLGKTGYDWDSERQEIDTVVIHHTSNQPGMTAERLNAMELLRIYVPTYARPEPSDIKRGIVKQPIYSGHFRGDNQVFNIYHWLVRPDGNTERHLEDHELGWHAGNWDINKRSIAVCIDDDLTDKSPTPETIAAIADMITTHYPNITVSDKTIVGHGEVRQRPTDCPGKLFLPEWKHTLLAALG